MLEETLQVNLGMVAPLYEDRTKTIKITGYGFSLVLVEKSLLPELQKFVEETLEVVVV